jgi:hypothetical protein
VIECARCGVRAPLPERVHRRYDRDLARVDAGEHLDGDVVRVEVPRANWFPLLEGGPPRLVCVKCATDDEINEWVMSEAWRDAA